MRWRRCAGNAFGFHLPALPPAGPAIRRRQRGSAGHLRRTSGRRRPPCFRADPAAGPARPWRPRRPSPRPAYRTGPAAALP
ncbi:hypothetical protein ACU4GD_22795 [Cupriavidus basilensis]